MPTVYTTSADTVYQAAKKQGKTAMEIYNDEKRREDAKFAAQQALQREQMQNQQKESEMNQLLTLQKMAQDKILKEQEMQSKIIEADDKIKLETHKEAVAQNLVPGNQDYNDYVIRGYNTKKSLLNTDMPSAATSESFTTPKAEQTQVSTDLKKSYLQANAEKEAMRKDVPKYTDYIANGTMKISQLPDDKITRPSVIKEFNERVAPENIKQYGEDGGKIKNSAIYDTAIDDKTRTNLSQAQQVFSDVDKLDEKLKEFEGDDKLQPILGIIESKSPYATKSQELKARIKTLVTNMARGVYSEVGTFTDQDFKTYESVLPSITNTNELNELLIKMTKDKIANSIKRTIENTAKGQKDVSNFFDLWEQTNNYLNNSTENKLINPIDSLYNDYKKGKNK